MPTTIWKHAACARRRSRRRPDRRHPAALHADAELLDSDERQQIDRALDRPNATDCQAAMPPTYARRHRGTQPRHHRLRQPAHGQTDPHRARRPQADYSGVTGTMPQIIVLPISNYAPMAP